VEVFLSRMTWSRKFAQPIALKDGRMIGTLAAALALMLSLPKLHQREAVWHDIGELLAEAATDRSWSQMRRRNYRKPCRPRG
jgi:hypothetical protein